MNTKHPENQHTEIHEKNASSPQAEQLFDIPISNPEILPYNVDTLCRILANNTNNTESTTEQTPREIADTIDDLLDIHIFPETVIEQTNNRVEKELYNPTQITLLLVLIDEHSKYLSYIRSV